MKPTLRVTEPDGARRVTSDGRFWSEVAATLEAIATRCAERGYVTDRLVLTGSGTDARDTWKVELVTTVRERVRARELKAKVTEVPSPEPFVDFEPKKLPSYAVRDFCLLTCGEETPAGLEKARHELSEALRHASFSRHQDNGFDLWRAKGRGAKHGSPRWRFLVRSGKIRRVLPEHDAGRRRGVKS